MREGDEARVQRLSAERFYGGARLLVGRAVERAVQSAIKRVAHDGVAGIGQMNANLMRAARQQIDRELRELLPFLLDHIFGDRSAAFGAHAHFFTIRGRTRNWRFDAAARGRNAATERPVFLIDFAVLKGRRQDFVRRVGFGDQHHARRVFIEAMHDAAAMQRPQIGKRNLARPQQIDERDLDFARARMHAQVARLVDDQNIVVLIQKFERARQLLRRKFRLRFGDFIQPNAGIKREFVAFFDRGRGFDSAAVERRAFADLARPRARNFQPAAQKRVYPHAGVVRPGL